MQLAPQILLWSWTALAAAWWVIAWRLARRAGDRAAPAVAPDPRRITVFKPLPRLAPGDLERLAPCLESYVAALDADSELLVGGHEPDGAALEAFLRTIGQRHPRADVRLVLHPDPSRQANPKVAWMEILAPHASGELWLWSDADIETPPELLATLRRDIAVPGTGFVTSPYVVTRFDRAPEALDALYVDVEFFPGVELLHRLGKVRFGFGSGMLFAARDFTERVDWDRLGSCIAEDYLLGATLAPARLGTTRVRTSPAAAGWTESIRHYLRWQKTVRWCRPWAYAGQLAILPLAGWLAWLPWHAGSAAAWTGLAVTLALEAAAAAAIGRALGLRIAPRHIHALPVWSIVRALAWVACWLPWPVRYGTVRWWSLYRDPSRSTLLRSERQVGLD